MNPKTGCEEENECISEVVGAIFHLQTKRRAENPDIRE
jgi:hypothetical protein